MQAQVRFISGYADRIKELENQVNQLKEQLNKNKFSFDTLQNQ